MPAHHRDDAITTDWPVRSGQYCGDAVTDGCHEAGVGTPHHNHWNTDRPRHNSDLAQPGDEPTVRSSRVAVGRHDPYCHDHRGRPQTAALDATVDRHNRARVGRFAGEAHPPGFGRRLGRTADETRTRARCGFPQPDRRSRSRRY